MSCRPLPDRPLLRSAALAALFVAACLCSTQVAVAASQPAVRGSGGAVASDAPLATEAGLEILAAGGNAVDAAVATALALAVVYPEAGNLGGGGFAVVRMRGKGGEEILASLDFREVAPAAASRDMYLDEAGELIPGASLVGPLAAGVPGSPHGLWELHQRYGRLPWGAVVEPARRLADQGFLVDEHLSEALAGDQKLLARFAETADLWLPGGKPLAPGTHLRLPDLAATLADYARRGPEAITTGAVARAVEETARRHGGVLTAADLEAYRPAWREPVRFEAYGWQVASMGLPSSGGIILGQSFAMLEGLGWQERPRFGADRRHLLTEVLRRSFADRYLLGDPSTTQATAADLLASAWLKQRQAEIQATQASTSQDVSPWAQEAAASATAEPGETTHLSTADADGGVVALTTTINGLFGCGLYVPGAGFFLNNEMDDFAAAPGKPNLFGLVQGEANAVRPGKRMLSSMSPTIAWRRPEEGAGEEAVAVGGRGGSRIPTNTLQVLLHVLVDGDGLQAALDRPRLHHQWLPDKVQVEPDTLSPETRAELERRGHSFEVTPATAKINAVRLLPGGQVEAANDPRSSGSSGVVYAGETANRRRVFQRR